MGNFSNRESHCCSSTYDIFDLVLAESVKYMRGSWHISSNNFIVWKNFETSNYSRNHYLKNALNIGQFAHELGDKA